MWLQPRVGGAPWTGFRPYVIICQMPVGILADVPRVVPNQIKFRSSGIGPSAVFAVQDVGLGRTPGAGFIGVDGKIGVEDGIEETP
jgi:hypothetical protein